MAGGRPATNRTLQNASKQVLIDEKARQRGACGLRLSGCRGVGVRTTNL